MSPSERAEHAAVALQNPALLEAFDAVRNEIVRLWAESSPAEKEAREYFWRLNEAQQMVERCLKGYLETGKLELMMEQESTVERVKRGLSRFLP